MANQNAAEATTTEETSQITNCTLCDRPEASSAEEMCGPEAVIERHWQHNVLGRKTETDKQANSQPDRQTGRHASRQGQTQKERVRERERESYRYRD